MAAVGAKTEGLARYRQKVLQRFPAAAREAIKEANRKNAEEFADRIRVVIPKGDSKNGHLVDSLIVRDGDQSDESVIVSLGDEQHPYPFHLEAGHRAQDGAHVPGKPFWNPTKRVMAKRTKARGARARSKA
ncbi:MAG: hypothetical protein EOP20_07150, partial [Hyphomicrobiales bacterium]